MFKNNLLTLIVLFILLGLTNKINAQWGFSHEVGAIAGPVAFQSDYGERHDFDTNSGNSGIGIGLIHYINFAYTSNCDCYSRDTYFNDHFKLRSELSYNRTKLDHFGEWVKPERQSPAADQLRAMHGKASVTNIGMQLEYFPWSIRDFEATIGGLAPFISLGAQFSYYNPENKSDLGPLGTPLTTYPKYLDPSEGQPYGFSNDGGTVWSIVSSVGTRYKLIPLRDLMIDLRFQYYFSDWVDGMNPNPDLHKENKYNDWLVWLNFGYIYYLQ